MPIIRYCPNCSQLIVCGECLCSIQSRHDREMTKRIKLIRAITDIAGAGSPRQESIEIIADALLGRSK